MVTLMTFSVNKEYSKSTKASRKLKHNNNKLKRRIARIVMETEIQNKHREKKSFKNETTTAEIHPVDTGRKLNVHKTFNYFLCLRGNVVPGAFIKLAF